ncbi:MAG: hypothetical protein ACRCZB_05570 [Bacteroidales bacterium]
MKKERTEKENWEEFRNTGLLWYINTILHVFGWCIQISIDNGKYSVMPVRTNYRGFPNESNDRGYKRVTEYLKNSIDSLIDETKDL